MARITLLAFRTLNPSAPSETNQSRTLSHCLHTPPLASSPLRTGTPRSRRSASSASGKALEVAPAKEDVETENVTVGSAAAVEGESRAPSSASHHDIFLRHGVFQARSVSPVRGGVSLRSSGTAQNPASLDDRRHTIDCIPMWPCVHRFPRARCWPSMTLRSFFRRATLGRRPRERRRRTRNRCRRDGRLLAIGDDRCASSGGFGHACARATSPLAGVPPGE